MKTNKSNSSRGQQAKSEPRDSRGRYETKGRNSDSSSSSSSSEGRGSNARNQPRDSNGRFTSNSKKK